MEWIRSSFCHFEEPQCIEITVTFGAVVIRDSTLGMGSPLLVVSRGAWQSFVTKVRTSDNPD